MTNLPDTLGCIEIFSSLSEEELSRVRLLMKRHEVPAGWVLFRQGDFGQLMYVVHSGKISIVIKAHDGEELEVARVGEGSFFGEMSILENVERSATCRTVEDCVLLSLDGEGFRTLMRDNPAVAIKIMYRMLHTTTGRLQTTGAFLSDMVTWGEAARIRAVTDDFTGLYNRRFFDDAIEAAVQQSLFKNEPLTLVIVDLDNFGTLNKEYGEAVGNAVIKASVAVFQSVFGEKNILSRYGGDEFAFLLPNCDGSAALSRCREICSKLRKLDLLDSFLGSNPGHQIQKITASIGLAVSPIHADSAKTLLEKADQALYGAKDAGRDCAVLFSQGMNEE